jgi:hypothetical protein
MWLIETDVFQMPQLHEHFNVVRHFYGNGYESASIRIMYRLLLLTLCLPTLAIGQIINTTEQGGTTNMYNSGIRRFIEFTSKAEKITLDTLYILKDDLLTDRFQARISQTTIEIMDREEISAKVDRDTSFVLYKFFPLGFDKGKFFISIVTFIVSKENGELIMANSGGCRIIFSFLNEQKRFKFLKVACGGF